MLLHFQIATGALRVICNLRWNAARWGNERGLYAGPMLLSTPKNALFHFFSKLSFFVSGRRIWHLICLDFSPFANNKSDVFWIADKLRLGESFLVYMRFNRVIGCGETQPAAGIGSGETPELTRMQSHKFLIHMKFLFELLTIGVTS